MKVMSKMTVVAAATVLAAALAAPVMAKDAKDSAAPAQIKQTTIKQTTMKAHPRRTASLRAHGRAGLTKGTADANASFTGANASAPPPAGSRPAPYANAFSMDNHAGDVVCQPGTMVMLQDGQ